MLWTTRGDSAFHDVFNDHLGTFGVVLFFAISGFLMAQLARASDAETFLVHRIARIYPVFLIAVAIWLPLRPLVGDRALVNWLTLTLAPVGYRDYPLGIEWTLVYETSFYVVIFLVAAAGLIRHLERIAAGWIVTLLVLSLTAAPVSVAEPFPFIQAVLLKDADVAFAAGLLLPWLIRRRLMPLPLCALGTLMAALVIWGQLQPMHWLMTPPALLMVAGLVQMRQMPRRGLGTIVIRLGDWSYALYLVHMPALVLCYRLSTQEAWPTALFLGSTLAAIVVAALVGALDVRLYRQLRRSVDASRIERRQLVAWAFATLYVGLGSFVAIRFAVKLAG